MKKQLLKKQEVARILSLSIGQVNYLIEQNKLETVEVKAGILRIKESSVVKYLNIKPEVGITLSRVFAILWAVAIIVFIIHLFLSGIYNSDLTGWTLWLLLINIGLGIIFFLAAFLTIGKISTKNILLPKKFNILYLSLIYLLIATIPVLAEGSIESEKKNNLPTPTPTQHKYAPTPTPTQNVQVKQNTQTKTNTATGSQVECIGPDGKHFNTSMDECKKLNEKWNKTVDYMVSCNIHPDCGGGTVYMAKSECDKPCSGRKQTTTPSINTTTPVGGSNYFCVNNVTGFTYYTSSGEQCNKDNFKAICLDTAKKLYYNPCMDNCLQIANDTSTYCIYNLTGDAQTACLDQKQKDHQSCMDACGVTYQVEYKKCY